MVWMVGRMLLLLFASSAGELLHLYNLTQWMVGSGDGAG